MEKTNLKKCMHWLTSGEKVVKLRKSSAGNTMLRWGLLPGGWLVKNDPRFLAVDWLWWWIWQDYPGAGGCRSSIPMVGAFALIIKTAFKSGYNKGFCEIGRATWRERGQIS